MTCGGVRKRRCVRSAKGPRRRLSRRCARSAAEGSRGLGPECSAAAHDDPGRVALLVEAEPKAFPGVRAAVNDVRAAGVELTVVARYVYLTLRVHGTVAAGVPADGAEKIRSDVIAAIGAYVAGLESGTAATGAALLKAIRRSPASGRRRSPMPSLAAATSRGPGSNRSSTSSRPR